jgi:hypothetical protein
MSETTRSEVINRAACPMCGAEAGEPCRGRERRNGSQRPRTRCHAERWEAAGASGREERNRRRLQAAERVERERRDLEAIARLREAATAEAPLRSP